MGDLRKRPKLELHSRDKFMIRFLLVYIPACFDFVGNSITLFQCKGGHANDFNSPKMEASYTSVVQSHISSYPVTSRNREPHHHKSGNVKFDYFLFSSAYLLSTCIAVYTKWLLTTSSAVPSLRTGNQL